MFQLDRAVAAFEASRDPPHAQPVHDRPLHIARVQRWLQFDWREDLRVALAPSVVYDDIVDAAVVPFTIDGEAWTARAWEYHPFQRTWGVRSPDQACWRRGVAADLKAMITQLTSEYRVVAAECLRIGCGCARRR